MHAATAGRNNAAGNVTITRNPLGLPTRIETKMAGNADVLVTYDYTYDAAHRLHTVTDSRGPTTITYDVSPGGRLNSIEDNLGNTTNYLYDPAGRLSGIWAPNYGTIAYRYDPGGRLMEKWLPNGVSSLYTWNADNSLKQVVNRRTSAAVISQHTYTYNGFGNRKTLAEKLGNGTINYTYTYDALGRLTKVANGDETAEESYAYDAFGNRARKTVNAVTPITTAHLYDAANQLLEAREGDLDGDLRMAFVVDPNGSTTKKCEGGTVTRSATDCTGDTVTVLTYNRAGRLTQAVKTGMETETYAYRPQRPPDQQADGRRDHKLLLPRPGHPRRVRQQLHHPHPPLHPRP